MTLDTISNLRKLAKQYCLRHSDKLDLYSDAALAQIYNGIGPESWDPAFRSAMDVAMQLYAPAALIHDLQFEASDGKQETFRQVAADWKANCRRIFDSRFPWLTTKMLDSSYRRQRLYWGAVMHAGNYAVSGKAAFRAWQRAAKAA